MRKLFFALALSVFFGLFSSELLAQQSGRPSNNNPRYNDLMLPSTSGVFRGIYFDMLKDEVLEIETARSKVSVYLDETDEELIVTTDMGREILDFADITYSFDEYGLYAIGVETYAITETRAKVDFDLIIEYFTKKFGKPTISEVDGYYEFNAFDEVSENSYTIALINIEDVEDTFGLYLYFNLD